MNKKIITTIFLISFLLTISTISVNSAPQEEIHQLEKLYMYADIYVDDDADSNWYDDTHVKTISEGVNAAVNGDKIFVVSGTYEEDYIQIKKPIKLIEQDKETTIIKSHIIIGDYISFLKKVKSFNKFLLSQIIYNISE